MDRRKNKTVRMIKNYILELPKKIKGKYMGRNIKVLNLGNWTKTEVFVEGQKVKGLIREVNINLKVGELTKVKLTFADIPNK